MKKILIGLSLMLTLSSFGQGWSYQSLVVSNITDAPNAWASWYALPSNNVVGSVTLVAYSTNFGINFYDADDAGSNTCAVSAYTYYTTVTYSNIYVSTNTQTLGTGYTPLYKTNVVYGVSNVVNTMTGTGANSRTTNVIFSIMCPANSTITVPVNFMAKRYLTYQGVAGGGIALLRYRPF